MISKRRRVTRSLRVKLTVAFASVVALVLAACGVLIFTQFTHYIDSRIDGELSERSVALRGLAANEVRPKRIIELSGESYSQIYSGDGAVLASSRYATGQRLLTPDQLTSARRGLTRATRVPSPPSDDGVRLVAFPIGRGEVATIGDSREGRESERDRLALLLLISLPGALLLASLTGYQVAGAALRPVERMRARAAEIGATDLAERLPDPGTGDELDRLAQTLNELLSRLQGALEHERRVVGDASHELRTPISVLQTRLDVALRGSGDAASLRAVLEEARADTGRLSRLADDLLVLARADQGRLPLRSEPLDVQDLLEDAAARHATAVGAAGRSLSVDVAIDGGAVVLGDPDRLGQVLDNLVVNSLRYGAGTIELSAVASAVPGRLEIVVADSGPGFADAFLPAAFDRFSQLDTGTGTGSGLGLALVEAIVRAHGGTASVSNRSAGGAQVRVALPLA